MTNPLVFASIIATGMLLLVLPLLYQAEGTTFLHQDTADGSASSTDINANDNNQQQLTSLEKARLLQVPLATDTQNAEFENAVFWEEHGPLLKEAWEEWEASLLLLDDGDLSSTNNGSGGDVGETKEWINPSLSNALKDALKYPSEDTESVVKSLWTSKYYSAMTTSTTTSFNSNDISSKPFPPKTQQQTNAQSYTQQQQPLLPKGVYALTPLLPPSTIHHLRTLLAQAQNSGIPTRRPNGMNRNGVILDPHVHGAIPMTSIRELMEGELVNRVVRPVGRMFFPEWVGCWDDLEYFAFTIQYDGSGGSLDTDENVNAGGDDGGDDGGLDADENSKEPNDEECTIEQHDNSRNNNNDDNIGTISHQTKDLELKEHRDASIITLNVNLNLPEEGYDGSQVYFRKFPSSSSSSTMSSTTTNITHSSLDELFSNCTTSDGCGTVKFSPGMAIIHLGAHRHGSLPILEDGGGSSGSGKRFNLVIWLFGKDGDVRIAPYPQDEQMSVVERWHGCDDNDLSEFSLDGIQ